MNVRSLSPLVLVAVLAGCATAPPPSGSLERARAQLRTAQADARVVSMAPLELKRAEQAMQLAEKIWAADGSPALVDHQAYLASQRVTIAQQTAASLADQSAVTDAAAQRDRMRLASRTEEADAARRQLDEARRLDAQKSTELAAAQSRSERDQQEARQQEARAGGLEARLAALDAKKTDRGMVVTLGDILFDSGRAEMRGGATRQMGQLADALRSSPGRSAAIEGFTDNVGSARANRELSGRRANAVMQALVGLGVPATHLRTAARGEESPVASNDTAVGRQLNRRVEIVFSQDAN